MIDRTKGFQIPAGGVPRSWLIPCRDERCAYRFDHGGMHSYDECPETASFVPCERPAGHDGPCRALIEWNAIVWGGHRR